MKKRNLRKYFVVFLFTIAQSVFASEKWYIKECQIVFDKPKVNGNTRSGECGVSESLEYSTTKTYSISEIDFKKGRLCNNGTKCIVETVILYKSDEQVTSCTNEYTVENLDGEVEQFPKQIVQKAKALKRQCHIKKLNSTKREEAEERRSQASQNQQRQSGKGGLKELRYLEVTGAYSAICNDDSWHTVHPEDSGNYISEGNINKNPTIVGMNVCK